VFNLKDFIEEQSEGDTDWEIDLSPLLALMVTLIPVLLLQTSFATLQMLETTLPILSDSKVEEPKDKNKIDFNLKIVVDKTNSIKLMVNVNDKVVDKVDLKSDQGKFDLVNFKKELVKIKEKYPKEVNAKLTPSDTMSYESIVTFLDILRKPDKGRTFRFIDEKGEKLESEVLFPNIVFGNISE